MKVWNLDTANLDTGLIYSDVGWLKVAKAQSMFTSSCVLILSSLDIVKLDIVSKSSGAR